MGRQAQHCASEHAIGVLRPSPGPNFDQSCNTMTYDIYMLSRCSGGVHAHGPQESYPANTRGILPFSPKILAITMVKFIGLRSPAGIHNPTPTTCDCASSQSPRRDRTLKPRPNSPGLIIYINERSKDGWVPSFDVRRQYRRNRRIYIPSGDC